MLNFHFSSFRERILFAIVGIVILGQVLSLLFFNFMAVNNAQYLIIRDLTRVELYIADKFAEDFEHIRKNASLIAGDAGLMAAVSGRDQKTSGDYLQRLGADIAAYFNSDGVLLGSTLSGADKDIERLFSENTQTIREAGDAGVSVVLPVGDAAYQAVMLPMTTSDTPVYILIGHKIDESYIEGLQRYISSEIAFVLRDPEQKEAESWTVVASTSPDFDAAAFVNDANQQNQAGMDLKMNPVISQVVSLEQDNWEVALYVFLQRSWGDTIDQYASHRPYLLIVTAILLVAAFPLAVYISEKVAQPVRKLAKASEQVAEGNYDVHVDVDQADELGLLAERFNAMIKGLADRERMKFLAYHDGLTELPNRRLLKRRLEEALIDYKDDNIKSALFLIDLDDFKPVNDTHGHDAGDAVLIETANRLNAAIENNEGLASRLGGDEFALLLKGANKKQVEQAAKDLIKSINQPIKVNDNTDVKVSASIGIALCADAQFMSDWMKVADEACYEAKGSGKNNYVIA